MGTSSSSLNNPSPPPSSLKLVASLSSRPADNMVSIKDNTVPVTDQNGSVSVFSSLSQSSPSSTKINFESPRKSVSVPVSSPAMNNGLPPVKSRWSFSSSKKSFGSKDETFFDTNQWLQSDSDDDFHSVNGDFTPSRGNTPKSSFSDRLPRISNLLFQEKKLRGDSSSPLPPQPPRRKKLAELFRDSIREEREESSEGSSSAHSTPYLSTANSGEFNESVKEKKSGVKSWHSGYNHHRCLPGFSSCGGSFTEKKKKMSPAAATPAVK